MPVSVTAKHGKPTRRIMIPDRIRALPTRADIAEHVDQLPAPTTVAIVDEEPLSRGGLEQLVAGIDGITVVTAVSSTAELADGERHDLVVLHIAPHDDEPSLRTITRMAQDSNLVIISAWDRPPGLLTTIRAGVRGCVTRQSTPESVARALNVVAMGGFYLCPRLIERFRIELNRPALATSHGLAPRENETLQWIARGLSHAQIAKRMGLTRATIDTYAKRIRAKLKVDNKAAMIRIALELDHSTSTGYEPTELS